MTKERRVIRDIKLISHIRKIPSITKTLTHLFLTVILIFLTSDKLSAENNKQIEKKELDGFRNSIIQIRVFSQGSDAFSPWQSGGLSGSTGTGFLIDKDRILTNAHVVSQAKFIEGQRSNQTEWYELETEFVAHDCDLAILKAKKKEFYDNSQSLDFGEIPELGSPVQIIGYPIGGTKISISRGVVSRIEQSVYAHSQADSHLVIQVDAAINPGNSGGPAIQEGKVVGVAFQGATKGENIGYVIPTNVINHFLSDIKDGIYDGYVELGIRTHNSFSDSERRFRQVPTSAEGVFVRSVLQGGSAEGFLKPGDLLVSVDGFPIGRNGTISFDSDNRVDFVELIDNKFANQEILFELIRDGKPERVSFPAKRLLAMDALRPRYNSPYPYFLCSGLVFQPLNRDLIEAWGRAGQTQGGSQLLYRFQSYLDSKDLGSEPVVLYRKLSHPSNASMDYFLNSIVSKVNGKPVSNFQAFVTAIKENKNKFLTIHFHEIQIPLILSQEDLLSANKEIAQSYSIVNPND